MKVALCLSVVALTGLGATGVERGGAPPATLGYYRASACTYQCTSGCNLGGSTGHRMETSGGTYGGLLHDECQAGQHCSTAHKCGGEEAFHPEGKMDSAARAQYLVRFEAVQEAAARGDEGAAVELLTRYPEHTSYNEERRSLQLAGCSAEVLAGNIPLSDAQLAAIASATQQ